MSTKLELAALAHRIIASNGSLKAELERVREELRETTLFLDAARAEIVCLQEIHNRLDGAYKEARAEISRLTTERDEARAALTQRTTRHCFWSDWQEALTRAVNAEAALAAERERLHIFESAVRAAGILNSWSELSAACKELDALRSTPGEKTP